MLIGDKTYVNVNVVDNELRRLARHMDLH